jgi:phosphoribosylformimino-5-aminoimidazole carboxamide ribotide isomerase
MGMGNNRMLIHRILREVSIPVQVGGGLRTSADVVEILDWGASRVLVGTIVFDRPEEFQQLLENVGSNYIVVALDYLEGKVVTKGWRKRTEFTVPEMLHMLLRKGVKIFLLTAVGRDGLMTGLDIETLTVCAQISGAHLIAAGGVGNLDDIARLRTLGIEEVVVGKALYEGHFTFQEALARFTE